MSGKLKYMEAFIECLLRRISKMIPNFLAHTFSKSLDYFQLANQNRSTAQGRSYRSYRQHKLRVILQTKNGDISDQVIEKVYYTVEKSTFSSQNSATFEQIIRCGWAILMKCWLLIRLSSWNNLEFRRWSYFRMKASLISNISSNRFTHIGWSVQKL